MAGIAAAEGIRRETLGRHAVSFDLNRRQGLRLVLVLEAVDEILGWKLIRRVGGILEQVADGVVVLLVGQAA